MPPVSPIFGRFQNIYAEPAGWLENSSLRTCADRRKTF
jgi:hypothetical protein